jgi:hypothetical protein
MMGFIDTYTFTQFGTTGNYSAIVILHTFQFTVAHALGFSVFTSRILATDLSQSHCNFNSHMKSSWHSLIHFLPFLQLAIPKIRLHSTTVLCSFYYISPAEHFYNHFARTPRKTPTSIVKNACLQLRCLATDVLFFRSFATGGTCLPTRCLEMGMHVTISFYRFV